METEASPETDRLLDIFRRTVVALVRRDEADLTARQLAVFLICYLESEPQTVRGMAKKLNISGAPVTRALDRLEEFGLARRKPDPLDRRSLFVGSTTQGRAFLRDLKADHAGCGPRERLAGHLVPR